MKGSSRSGRQAQPAPTDGRQRRVSVAVALLWPARQAGGLAAADDRQAHRATAALSGIPHPSMASVRIHDSVWGPQSRSRSRIGKTIPSAKTESALTMLVIIAACFSKKREPDHHPAWAHSRGAVPWILTFPIQPFRSWTPIPVHVPDPGSGSRSRVAFPIP